MKRAEQIAATLDEQGCLDGIPFMPEMVVHCGRTFVVRSSAHKTCAADHGKRSMDAAVHLEGLRCDGSAHGGCQVRCSLFWKDAWLEPAPAGDAAGEHGRDLQASEHGAVGAGEPDREASSGAAELRRKAALSTRLHGRDPAEGTYSCQATELAGATTPLPMWSPRQYWDDVRSGNITLATLVLGLWVMALKAVQRVSDRILPAGTRLGNSRLHPRIAGTLQKTPDVRLDVQPGETVWARSLEEVVHTLDARGCNRGLSFEPGMAAFCGKRLIVHHCVEAMIDEATGELRRMKNPCVVFDGVACNPLHRRFCPRANDSYWREAWLRRGESGEV